MYLKTLRWVIIPLALIISITQHVEGDGMIEVFRWKQIDFYNRGDQLPPSLQNQQVPGAGNYGNSRGSSKKPTNQGSGSFVFPDQLDKRRNRRNSDTKTSRDESSIKIHTRWNDETIESAIHQTNTNGSFIPYNNVPMGVTHFRDRLFVTMPRRRTGIPSTLNYIDMARDGKQKSPKLNAYPNFETNYLSPDLTTSPERLVSVYRTTVDACDRLWFIDTGMLEYPDNRMQIKRPTIWVIDLRTDRVVHRFEIPQSVVDTGRGLASLTIDVTSGNCGNAFAYIPDLVNAQLFVYSLANNRIWSFSHNYFNFDPLGGDLHVGGQTFRWDDGIFSVTLGPTDEMGFRTVFFHAMASNNEFYVSAAVLQNESNAARSDHGNDFRILGSRGSNHQSTMHEYNNRTGTIFYDEIQKNGVGCWNTNKPFSAENHGTVFQDAERMIYPSDLTIDEDGTIWVMSNSMPIFIYSSLNPNTFNFRIWKQNVVQAARNTICQV